MSNSPRSPSSSPPVRVCLVEDHEAVRDQLRAQLGLAGMQIVAAVGTIAAGEQAVVDSTPDVAVIDNQLPDGLGMDLCRILKRRAPGVVLLMHTGVVTDDLEADALAAGASAVIPKTIRGTGLIDAILAIRQKV